MAEFKRVELTSDDVIGPAAKNLSDYIFEAKELALKENIKANTVLINESFAKVNGFSFCFVNSILDLPPMICGLEIHVTNELPEGYSFAVAEAPETERDRICRQAKAEVAREIFEEIEGYLSEKKFGTFYYNYLKDILAELKKKYTEEQS